MINYIQLHFEKLQASQQEILIAQLADIGFEGFEEGLDFLNACIPESLFDKAALQNILGENHDGVRIEIIEQKNWNEQWEKSFDPVIIGNFCAIRADFHLPVEGVKEQIIITPKMSFGTGHHATTFQVIQLMEQIKFENKNVLDFGTGTGVLAILAEKLGAKQVVAIDNDEWSISNAKENIKNKCSRVELLQSVDLFTNDIYDIILANINKHVILQNLPSIAKHLSTNGVLILSGLLKSDEAEIQKSALKHHLIIRKHLEKLDWIALYLTNVNAA